VGVSGISGEFVGDLLFLLLFLPFPYGTAAADLLLRMLLAR
jgi:hypothetical protein